ncbi:MAG: hypothetical protein HRT40_00770 [Campylobacteraceae bacterium]|nr:hypothetical protein [Campylobacteraceae bacterium]
MFKIIISILLLYVSFLNINAKNIKKNNDINLFIQTRNYISDYLVYFSDNLDYFITQEKKTKKNKSAITLRFSSKHEKNKDTEYDSIIRISIRLPNTEKKLKVIIIDDNKNDGENDDKSVELEYQLISDIKNSLYLKAGLKIKSKLEQYLSLRYKLSYLLKSNIRSNIIQDLTYSSDEKFVSTSSIDFIKYIKYPFYIKNYYEYKYTKEKDLNQSFFSLTLFQKLKRKDYFAYEINTTRDNKKKSIRTEDYEIDITYRSYLKKWLYFEIIPKVIYRKENNFSSSKQINFNFSMSFNK